MSDDLDELAVARDLFGESERLPVITLWQPYASLCFCSDVQLRKRNETRGYPPPRKYVGRRIGIQAAAQFPPAKEISEELNDLAYDAFGCGYNFSLPRGVILGTVRLGEPYYATEAIRNALTGEERAAGNYADKRWVWPLIDPQALPAPLPAKGKQGWWSIELAALRAHREGR